MTLCVHGEVTDPAVDIFDREAVFIERVLAPLRVRHPGLKIVFGHITTKDAADFVAEGAPGIAATITPHHLTISRNAMFEGGIRPHHYCLPVAKREAHRLALRKAAISGNPRFFLGTDSAPHARHAKEAACGCAGIYNAPVAIEAYAQAFDEEGALDKLEGFASREDSAFASFLDREWKAYQGFASGRSYAAPKITTPPRAPVAPPSAPAPSPATRCGSRRRSFSTPRASPA